MSTAGSGCGDRASGYSGTIVDKSNPTSEAGSVTALEVGVTNSTNGRSYDFGFFTNPSSNNLLCVAADSVTVTATNESGYFCHQFEGGGVDFTSFDVDSGMYVGCYCGGDTQEYGSSGGAVGLWYVTGDHVPEDPAASFSYAASYISALGAEITAAGGPTTYTATGTLSKSGAINRTFSISRKQTGAI